MIQNWLNIVSIPFNAQKSRVDYNPNIFWDALKNIVYVHLMIAISRYRSYKCPVCPVVLCGSPGGALDISSVGVALGCLVAMIRLLFQPWSRGFTNIWDLPSGNLT